GWLEIQEQKPLGTYVITEQDFQDMDDETRKAVEGVFRYANTKLGGTSVDTYLEREDFETAFAEAVGRYRDTSSRAVKFMIGILVGEANRQVYQMPKNVDAIRRVQRATSVGFGAGNIGPSLATAAFNSIMQQSVGGGSSLGGLIDYNMYMSQIETLQKMFAADTNWYYDESNRQLHLYTAVADGEKMLVELSMLKSIKELLNDHFAYTWLRDYTLASAKGILGEKLSIFEILPGPAGGVTTKGNALKEASAAEIEKLMNDLYDYSDSPEMIPPIIRG
ncbi:MAG: hypothetical protein D6698_03065, partial [Gammaproteobacteria bacterium]